MARVLKPGGVLFIDHEGCAERWTGRVHFGHFRLFSRFLAAAPYCPIVLARRYLKRRPPEQRLSADYWTTRDRYVDFASIQEALSSEFGIEHDECYLNYGQAHGRLFDLPGARWLWGVLWSPFVVSERLLIARKAR